MKTFFIYVFFLAVVLIEAAGFPSLFPFGLRPGLVFSLVLSLVLLKSFKQAWSQLLFISVLADFFSGLPFGLLSLSLMTSAFLVDCLNKGIFSVVSFWVMAGFAFLGTFLYNLLLIGLMALFFYKLPFNFRLLLGESLANLLLIIVFSHGLKKILCWTKE